ncbi:hypothetical protein FPQ18DRAFT_6186 [Pyronema domesticum]|uniref:Calmodulin n=1 Tax=Pyronema omphalodes (strain CBS 100304) TaxID=1076935 RepID=U4LA59_PYROM|nr:hypothetical protein FPQ18DRAFT_6186 [Pyronema domesticum]CCX10603.1 Similar to Cell division control protein 31; acc. no. O74435 [Pyronema omphalodes CBS 100304]
MSMFGAGRQNGGPPQSARTRRPNIRSASPGPSSGGNLFGSTATGAGKAPAAGYSQQPQHREREQYPLTQDQREEINEAFNLFDLNTDQKIDYHELRVAMKALGFDCPKTELTDILRRHGVLLSGQPPAAGTSPSNLYITSEAFMEIMSQKLSERDPMEEIERAFELFAGVGSGRQDGREAKISIEDLRRVAKELGESLEEEELQAMIEEFDMDNDGMISKEEFISICRGD